jgi:hypothetical protein
MFGNIVFCSKGFAPIHYDLPARFPTMTGWFRFCSIIKNTLESIYASFLEIVMFFRDSIMQMKKRQAHKLCSSLALAAIDPTL